MDTTLHTAQAIMGGAVPSAAIASLRRLAHFHTSRAEDLMVSAGTLLLASTTNRTHPLQELVHRLMTVSPIPTAQPTAQADSNPVERIHQHAPCLMNDRRHPPQTSAAQQQNGHYAASGQHKQAASQHEATAQLHREAAALHEAALPIKARAIADRALSSSAQAHLASAAAG